MTSIIGTNDSLDLIQDCLFISSQIGPIARIFLYLIHHLQSFQSASTDESSESSNICRGRDFFHPIFKKKKKSAKNKITEEFLISVGNSS